MASMNDVLLACTVGDTHWLKRGLSNGTDPSSRNNEGLNGLHLAAKYGMLDCIKSLLDNHLVDVNDQVPSTGDTAIHCMLAENIGKRSIKCIRLLLDNGGDFKRQNKAGQTPLHLAAKFGRAKCLKFLLERGANIDSTDNDGHTAYDLACLHGRHECARLLRALHWANKKDFELDIKLKSEHLQKSQEKEYTALRNRLRLEAAECAFEDWLEQKSISRSSTPGACEERREARSRASKTSSCVTCTRTTSKQQSAISKSRSAQINAHIKVNHHQQHRNVDAVGKPRRLYPYTNYPPKHLRSSANSQTKSKQATKSGRSSRATATHSEPILARGLQKKAHSLSSVSPSELEPDMIADRQVVENEATETAGSGQLDSEINVALNLDSNRELEGLTEPFSLKGDFSEEEDDDLLFHDVGCTNNLDALSLPSSITKDKTPAEVIQLLRSLDEPGSRQFHRSHSVSLRKTSLQGAKYQRRLSLGAIPEGRMVTSYSDEDQSTSQLLDSTFIEELINTFSSNQVPSISAAHNENHKCTIGWDTDNSKGTTQLEKDSPKHIEVSSTKSESRRGSLTLPLFSTQSQRKSSCPSPNTRLEQQQTLKVVNMEWEPTSSSVQSIITKSPLTPPPEFYQRQILPPKLSPRLSA